MKVSRARVGFQVLLHAVLAGHVLAYYLLDWKRIGAIDFQAFFHYFLGEGLLTAGAIFTIAMFAGALLFGRLFCSWGCHFGATQDLAAWLLRKTGWRPPLVRTRFLHQAPYLVLLAVFILPLAERWRSAPAWGPVEVDLAAVAPWDTLPGALLSAITFAACGAGILLFLGTRGFCRFVCPYGAIFRVTDRVAPFRVRRVAACGSPTDPAPGSGCGAGGVHPCTRACPTAIDVHAETEASGKVTSPDCVRCHLCIEACPSQALAHTTAGRALAVPAVPTRVVPRRAHDLPLWGEGAVLAVAVATYLAVDLVYGGHFLAATLGLGEGFLAFTVLRALLAPGRATVLGRPLRAGRRWTFLGVTAAGALVLSAVPILQAGTFRWLRREGLRLDPGAAPAARADPGAEPFSPPAAGAVLDPPSRARLEAAAERYRMAVALFPSRLETRRLLLGAYARLGDPRAVEEAGEIARRSPPGDPGVAEALLWVRRRFGVVPAGGLPDKDAVPPRAAPETREPRQGDPGFEAPRS